MEVCLAHPDPKDQVIVKAILFATVLGTSLSAREIAEFIARREVTEEEWQENGHRWERAWAYIMGR